MYLTCLYIKPVKQNLNDTQTVDAIHNKHFDFIQIFVKNCFVIKIFEFYMHVLYLSLPPIDS